MKRPVSTSKLQRRMAATVKFSFSPRKTTFIRAPNTGCISTVTFGKRSILTSRYVTAKLLIRLARPGKPVNLARDDRSTGLHLTDRPLGCQRTTLNFLYSKDEYEQIQNHWWTMSTFKQKQYSNRSTYMENAYGMLQLVTARPRSAASEVHSKK